MVVLAIFASGLGFHPLHTYPEISPIEQLLLHEHVLNCSLSPPNRAEFTSK